MNKVITNLFVKKIIDTELFNKCKKEDNPIDFIYDYFKENNKDITELIKSIESNFNIKYINLSSYNILKEHLDYISNEITQKFNVYCIDKKDNEIILVTFKPIDNINKYNDLLNELDPLNVKLYFAFKKEIEEKIKEVMSNKKREIRRIEKTIPQQVEDTNFSVNPNETMKKVNLIIDRGIMQEASDIHIEPYNENIVRVRLRIDGELSTLEDIQIHPKEYTNIVSRIKVMASLDPAERRKSQDGKIASYMYDNIAYDLRVSSMFTIMGEKIVIRIIKKITGNKDLSNLGFHAKEIERIDELISKPNGILLVTGETGSGKSTTVYTIINMLNNDNVNICTVEDPVESEIEGVAQVQVNELADITFLSALKTFLRQDPDIILVGEVRDYETADIAIKAANTGHFVLSTIHTNNATATINRLTSMGIESYKISEGIVGIVSQRLVKKLCPHCKVEHKLTIDEYNKFKDVVSKNNIGNIDEMTFYENNPLGCSKCNKGYKGRLVVPEILAFNENINNLIARNLTSVELRNQIINDRSIFLPFEYTVFLKKDLISIDSIKEFI